MVVQSNWIDLYGHVTAARCTPVRPCRLRVLARYGVGESYTREEHKGSSRSLNTRSLSELVLGDEIELSIRFFDDDDKQLLSLFELRRVRDGCLSTTMEQLSLNVSLATRKVRPFQTHLQSRLKTAVAAHAPPSKVCPDASRYALPRRKPAAAK
ncbi:MULTISPECIES: thioesterase family protein [Burkholderia]|uniref:thioesterase family protein n=1 Tax=Burkholderia TaxID=32008 RepID=UPI0035AB8694